MLLGKIIVIANQKGGVGKTTTAVNVSACLAEKGYRTLLVDIDPQGNATSGLGFEKRDLTKTIYEVMIDDLPIQEAILETGIQNLFLLPSSMHLAGAEVEMVAMMSREKVLFHVLSQIEGEYDFVFIDSPPSLGLLTINALSAANQVLVPIQCEFYALEGLSQLMNTIKLVKTHLNPHLEIEGVVLTMFDSRTNLSIQVVEEVKKYFEAKVHRVIIPRNVRLGEAPSYGKVITQYDPACVGARAYQDLADELVEREQA